MKRVYEAANLVDAELMADYLRDALIPVELFNQHIGSGFGELPASYPEVWVRRDADVEKALTLVGRLEEQRRQSRQDNAKNGPQSDRQCLQCNELNPSSFDLCWQCQTLLPLQEK